MVTSLTRTATAAAATASERETRRRRRFGIMMIMHGPLRSGMQSPRRGGKGEGSAVDVDISCDVEAQVEGGPGGVVVTDMTKMAAEEKKMTREISFPEQERESDARSEWAKKVRERRSLLPLSPPFC